MGLLRTVATHGATDGAVRTANGFFAHRRHVRSHHGYARTHTGCRLGIAVLGELVTHIPHNPGMAVEAPGFYYGITLRRA